jgi:hypothetical protein
MADTKMTKVEILGMIKEACEDNEVIVEFCDKEIAALGAKAEKAKARAAAKKAEGDELRAIVASVLTTEPMIAEDVLAAITGVEDLTKAKVIARLTQLCKAGDAVKTEVTVDGKKRMAYSLAE